MSSPRLEVDLAAIEHNARVLTERLGARGIGIAAVTKAVRGSPTVGAALLRGGAARLADSRVENLSRLSAAHLPGDRTLIRTPMLSQVEDVVRVATVSLNSEEAVLDALSAAARWAGVRHGVLLMVELGDLREGVEPAAVVALARRARALPHLDLVGIGANLACQSGVMPDQVNMGELTRIVVEVEDALGGRLEVVSGGNSASLGWANRTQDVGRVNELRLGEALLLGLDPLSRMPIVGLRTDAFTVLGELIEVQTKPTQPWGRRAQAAFGAPPARRGTGRTRQGIVALGRQEVDPLGLRPPAGVAVLGVSSDHLVLDLGDHDAQVGDELGFGVDYSCLLRAATSLALSTTPALAS